MQKIAKVFNTNRSQAVRLPKEFRFNTSEVLIRRRGEEIILTPRPSNWSDYLDSDAIASSGFMAGVEDLPVQERDS